MSFRLDKPWSFDLEQRPEWQGAIKRKSPLKTLTEEKQIQTKSRPPVACIGLVCAVRGGNLPVSGHLSRPKSLDAGSLFTFMQALVHGIRPFCTFWILAWLLATDASAGAGSMTGREWFDRGLSLSRQGLFPEASQAFETSADLRPTAGAYVDLGLAEWHQGHAGKAILAWKRALWIAPANSQARENEAVARQMLDLEDADLLWYEEASTWLSPSAWIWLSAAMLWLAASSLVLPVVLFGARRDWHRLVAAIALAVFFLSLIGNAGVVGRMNLGVVLGESVPLRLTPTTQGEVIANLSSGESLRRLRSLGHFDLVQCGNLTGWLAPDQYALVCPGSVSSKH